MTIKRKTIAKRTCAVMMSLAIALPTGIPAVNVKAETDAPVASEYFSLYDENISDYKYVWGDEFDGTSLNLSNWNIEKRPAAWVNDELQAYPGKEDNWQDNIVVEGGVLKLLPKKTEKADAGEDAGLVDVLEGNGFDATWTGATVSSKKATIAIQNVGTNAWDVQCQKAGMTLTKGHVYKLSFKAKADEARKFQYSVTNTKTYVPFKDATEALGTEVAEYGFEFTMGDCDPEKVAIQFNLGNFGAGDSALTNVELSDIKLIDMTESTTEATTKYTEIFENNKFDDSWTGGTITDGKAKISISDVGTNAWDVQFQKAGMTLTGGHDYKLSFKAKAGETRKFQYSVTNTKTYVPFKDSTEELGTEFAEYGFQFTMGECESGKVAIQFNLGNLGAGNSAATDVEITDISLLDLSEPLNTSEVTYKNYDFTSGRINTENNHNFTYGLFECRAKVPKGEGYLPAFWLMAANEDENDEYGVWPTCGEIDMMEVLGNETDLVHGTIHYGLPRKQNQGKYKITKAGESFSDTYHTFATKWEPGKITWYVDGIKYYETSDWFSTREDGKTLAYPAPFDHDMYIILNLAVGGSWVGYPDKAALEDMENQSFDIDYVRVYQLDEYDENVSKPEGSEVGPEFRDPDANGNYVVNGDFSSTEELYEEEGQEDSWTFKQANGGVGSAEIKNGEMVIKTENEGTVDYSIQLVQPGIPLVSGKKYEFTFEAKASAPRKMQYAIQNTSDWDPYYGAEVINLTTDYKQYGGTFNVYRASNPSARIDLNMGAFESTADISIKNVVLKQIGDADVQETDETKYPRNDGNRIYNGGFDEGVGRLAYWEITKDTSSDVYSSNDTANGKRVRRLVVQASGDVSESNPILIEEKDVLVVADREYKLSLNVEGPAASKVGISFGDYSNDFTLTGGADKLTDSTNVENEENKTFAIKITTPGTYYIDDVFLEAVDNGLIKNGNFGDYSSKWSSYTDSSATAKVTYKEGEAKVAIDKVGSEDWHVQLNQNNINLEKGKAYKLSFKAKSDLERAIKVSIQKNGGTWTKYSGVIEAALTNEYKEYTRVFEMTSDTDDKAQLNMALGQVGDTAIQGSHNIYLDDIVLEYVDAETIQQLKQAAAPVIEKIAQIDEVELTSECKAVIDAAKKAYDALSADEKDFVDEDSTVKLNSAIKLYNDLDAADKVIKLIEAIGTVEATDASKAAIVAAQDAYDALTDDQKKLVDEDSTEILKDAEPAYNKAVADIVIDKIKAIGTVEATDASKAAIDAAKAAYEALTDDQKKFIDDATVAKIADAEVAYAKAVEAKAIKDADDKKKAEEAAKAADDKAAADAVIAKINAIGTVTATDASKAAIDEATKAYIALTDDQKLLVDATTFQKLNDAKKTYDAAVATQTTTPAEDKGKTDNDGKAEKGETAVTDKGTFTATSATTASFTPSAEAKAAKTLVVPDTATIDGQTVKVTSVPAYAFKGAKNLTSLTIGANVTSLGAGVAQNATKLATVKFKTTNLTSIGANAFAGDTSLASIDLSKQTKLTTIGANAFNGCKKCKTIKIYGNKLKTVKKSAFKGAKNNKNVKVFVYAKNKTIFNKVVKLLKKAGLSKATFKFSKKK